MNGTSTFHATIACPLRSAMMPAFESAPHTALIIRYLEKLLSGEIKKVAIITPPRHGKSTLGNVMLPAFALGRNPRETIITVSYGSDLAEGFGRRVRNILSDPAFRELFPACQLSPDSQAAYRFETTAGGEFSAVGRGGPVTGRGASLLILDDLVKDVAEANSETVCRGIIEWLEAVAFTRLTPSGRVLAIATRWSERDPIGWLITQSGWTILHLPALAQENDPLGRRPGEALWPSHYTVEALEKIRADVGSRVFQCLYQGNVSAVQGAIFKRNWFRRYHIPPEKFLRVVQSWDTAFKSGATNDYSVCVTFGEASNGFYLLGLYRAKCEFPELKRQVALQAEFWRPSEILVEDKASGQSLIQELKLSTSYPVIPIKIDHDKETRASAVTGYFESGRVLFPEGAAWLPDLEDELAAFPGGMHDDIVGSICQALNHMRGNGQPVLGLIDLYKSGALERFLMNMEVPKTTPLTQTVTGATTPEGVVKDDDTPVCPDFKSTLTVIIAGGQRRCQQCARQWWPRGSVSEIPRITRGDFLSGRLSHRYFFGR